MTIILYDLCGADDHQRFSPYCWRARMALAHKGLDVETRATRFTEIAKILDGGYRSVPLIVDNDRTVRDSWEIALHLEDTYADRPSLFAGEGGNACAKFIENWANGVLHGLISRMIIADIHAILADGDKAYFQESREARFGKKLSDVQAGRDQAKAEFAAVLTPLRKTLQTQPFIGGHGPLFADHIVFGSLQWARVASKYEVLDVDDPVRGWFERCLDLYDGAGRSQPAAA